MFLTFLAEVNTVSLSVTISNFLYVSLSLRSAMALIRDLVEILSNLISVVTTALSVAFKVSAEANANFLYFLLTLSL